MRARFSMQMVHNNVRQATQIYETKFRRMIIRQAAATRKDAVQSINWKRDGFPRNHTGAYKNNIRFAWDPGSKTAIAGPTWLKHFNAPRALEFGGVSRWLRRAGSWFRSGLQRVRKFGTMRRALTSAWTRAEMVRIAREELA